MGHELFGLIRKNFLSLIVLSALTLFMTGCPEGGEGGAEGAGAEGPAAAEAPAEASEGAGSENGESAAETTESADAASDEAIRLAEDSSAESSHFYLTMNEEGVIQAIDEIGFKSEPIGRFDQAGRLWEVNSAGQPIRVIANIRNGLFEEVNALGQIGKVIGRLRATFQGNLAIDIYPNTSIELGRIGTLHPGDVIEILDAQWDWLRVKEPSGQEGWIRSSILFAGKDKSETRDQSEAPQTNGLRNESVPKDWDNPEPSDMFGQKAQPRQQTRPR